MPGYDEPTKEITRKFAAHGYLAICPNLYWREAPGASPDDAAAAARAQGGVPDERLVGDVGRCRRPPAIARLVEREGGHHRVLLGRPPVVPGRLQPPARRRRRLLRRLRRGAAPRGAARSRCGPIVHLAKDLSCPLLGLFGAEDQYPRPAEVARAREGVDRPRQDVRVPLLRGRRPRLLRHQPNELPARGGQRGLGADLGVLRPPPRATDPGEKRTPMCTYQTTSLARARQRQRRRGMVRAVGRHRLLRPSRPRRRRPHPEHRSAEPGPRAAARVALELDPVSATTGPGPRHPADARGHAARAACRAGRPATHLVG